MFFWLVFGEYCTCVFGRVSLSALWWVLGKYWICVFGKVSLSILWRVFC